MLLREGALIGSVECAGYVGYRVGGVVPGGDEAERGGSVGRQAAVVADIACCDGGPALGERGVPRLADLLAAGEGEGRRPARGGGGGAVRDRHFALEGAAPLGNDPVAR